MWVFFPNFFLLSGFKVPLQDLGTCSAVETCNVASAARCGPCHGMETEPLPWMREEGAVLASGFPWGTGHLALPRAHGTWRRGPEMPQFQPGKTIPVTAAPAACRAQRSREGGQGLVLKRLVWGGFIYLFLRRTLQHAWLGGAVPAPSQFLGFAPPPKAPVPALALHDL